jgi:hypothetical protein
MRLLTALMFVVVTVGNVALQAQSTQQGDATQETYVCPDCGKLHTRSAVQRSAAGVSNVMSALNSQRARQGIASLRYDPQLQAVAERRAKQMAASGQKGHPSGSFAPGTYEGVGWSSSYSPSGVSACYTSDPRMKYAGAAMVPGRDGVYFAVVYR